MSETKVNSRLEAFSDGVYAIAITLLILEIKVPPVDSIHSAEDLWHGLYHLWPSYFALLFSFGSILVSWVNHHHTFGLLDKSSRPFMYANGFLLLTITFLPFPTALLAEYIATDYSQPAIAFYCFVSALNAFAWTLLGSSIYKPKLLLKLSVEIAVMDKTLKAVKFGLLIYLVTALLSFWFPLTALTINFSLWILWVSLSLRENVN
jgi:uncharacterized membrane protein